jgi:hypothetical protein
MRVYVHGNCQAPAIASMISDQFPDWNVSSYEIFNKAIIDEIDRYHELVNTSDIIISQPIHDGYRNREDLSLSWVKSTAKPDAALVVFPSMHFDGQLIGWRSVSMMGYGMPYHDMLQFHLAAAGVSSDRITAILLDEDLHTEAFILKEIELAIGEIQRREAMDHIDVPLSPFLQEFSRQAQLFHIINHPCRPALSFITNGVLRHLGYAANVAARGRRYLLFPQVPPAPSVIRFLRRPENAHPVGWDFEDGDRFHLPKATLTRAEYYARAVADLRLHPPEDLMACLRDPYVTPFLNRLAAANPGLPGIDIWRH